MSAVFTGSISSNPYKKEEGWNRDTGRFMDWFWRGDKNTMEGVKESLITSGAYTEVSIGHDGVIYEVRARSSGSQPGTDDPPTLDVRMQTNYINVDILAHPAFAPITDEGMKLVSDSIQNHTELAYQFGAGLEDAEELYWLAFRGVRSYEVEQPIITVSATANATHNFGNIWLNVGKIIPTNMLAAEIGLALNFDLPVDGTPRSASFAFGWKKKRPEYNQSIGGKASMSQQYEYGEWALKLTNGLLTAP